MTDFGGLMRFTVNGSPLRIKAKVEVEPVNARYTVEHNQDGTFCRYVQPEGPTFDIEFVDSKDGVSPLSVDWDTLLKGGPYNCALVEEDNDVLHNFTQLQFMGRPKLDRLKGIVTGITGQCPVGGYLQTSA